MTVYPGGISMTVYQEKFAEFLREVGNGKKMVLSTSGHDVVTSRMMSVIQLNGSFYFQTDRTSRKYAQLLENPRAALCVDNIQMEGLCRETGHPREKKMNGYSGFRRSASRDGFTRTGFPIWK